MPILKYSVKKFSKTKCTELRNSGWFVDTKNLKDTDDEALYNDYRAIKRKHYSMQCLSKGEKHKIVKEAKKRGMDKEYESGLEEDAKQKNILGM